MANDPIIDEIKSRLDIVQIVSEYVTLKKAGTRMAGLCPFHSERTPSFSVSPDMQFWYCFGCNEGGDIINFVQRMEGTDFADALKMLAKRAGVQLRQEDQARSSRKQRLIDVNAMAAKFFHEVLLKAPQAEAARKYAAEQRALKPETIDDLLIGYAPDSWEATSNALRKKGFKDEEIAASGLTTKREKGSGYFDRFRNRLMFPIRDVNGNVVGFTGRVLPGSSNPNKEEAKYVNTQQTEVYNKGAILFGLDRAKRAIRKVEYAVVVEGNMDVVASHQAGITNVVASSGTALSEQQLELLGKYTDKLVLSFDNDPAGERAARRGIELALQKGFSIRVLRLPPGAGKDPDDAIRKDVKLWQQAIADSVPYMQWNLDLVRERVDLADPDAKKHAAQELVAEIAKLPPAVERAHWVKEVATLFMTPESLLFEEVEKVRGNAKFRPAGAPRPDLRTAPAAPVLRTSDRYTLLSEHLFGLILAWPAGIAARRIELEQTPVEERYGELYKAFLAFYTQERSKDGASSEDVIVREYVQRQVPDAAKIVASARLRAEQEFGALTDDGRRGELTSIIGELKHLHASRRREELTYAMAEAEKAGDMATIQHIQEQLQSLIRGNA
jgi:DNA primase